MKKPLRYCSFLAVAGWLLAAQALAAAEGINGKLVSAAWLGQNLKNADLLILDASSSQSYASNHIPGAVSVDLLMYGVQEAPLVETEKRYQSWGISPRKRVVLYDQGGSAAATRVFFSLEYHGFPTKHLFVLDGGLAKWQEQGLPVTKEATPAPKKGSFKIKRVNEDLRGRLPEFLAATGDPVNNVLLEALGANWHFGEALVFDRAGHVPHATMLPSADFFNPDKTFKSPGEIRRMLTYLGIKPEQQIYTHCGGGIAASVPFFALRHLLHYPKVKLYTESEMGWLSDERALPFWTYDAPFLLRATSWLQFWGGPRIRSFGGERVSIVDVRPPETFSQGHLPFALNIPADVFKGNLNSPEKLAEILGPAGVDASHEAVVVSGAGLTKESALAFLMLDQVGQRKASIFTDSMDTWAQRGFALPKDATVVAPKKSRGDVSIPPTTYRAVPRTDVIIADPRSTEGLYPKVLIASGKDLPTRLPDGKVVHVPYTELLNTDGTPKAAGEIWKILVKAGVPRYAELVCFSEDPGEAAVTYFVLKLMGYPDIKVLVM